MIRQLHLPDRFVMAQSTLHVVIGNRGRPIHHDKVINRLRERGIHCRPPARGKPNHHDTVINRLRERMIHCRRPAQMSSSYPT